MYLIYLSLAIHISEWHTVIHILWKTLASRSDSTYEHGVQQGSLSVGAAIKGLQHSIFRNFGDDMQGFLKMNLNRQYFQETLILDCLCVFSPNMCWRNKILISCRLYLMGANRLNWKFLPKHVDLQNIRTVIGKLLSNM